MLSERQMAERRLQGYLVRRLAEVENEVAPELREYVTGNSEAEIDRAIDLAKRKTAQILSGVRQAQARPDDVDPAWAANVREGISDLPDVSQMSMSDYAKLRRQLGIGRAQSSGLFGPIQ